MDPQRIGLLGGECTGKTTLAEDLARTLPAFVAEEAHIAQMVETLAEAIRALA